MLFIQPDTDVPESQGPQSLNRYAYGLNNPLKYIDSSGHFAVVPVLLGVAAIAEFAGVAFLAVEGGKMAYGEMTIQMSNAVNDASRYPLQGTSFEPIALRAAINIQEVGMLYDDVPGTGSRGLGAVRPDVVKSKLGLSYSMDQIQNDHELNVKLRAALMAHELAQCRGCSKTDQYIALALAQNDYYGVAEGFLKEGWDAILGRDDATARLDNGIRTQLLKLTGQGWDYGRMRFELREFVAQLRQLLHQGWKLPEGVNLDYMECLGNGGDTSKCAP
jgi:hypothetical protein